MMNLQEYLATIKPGDKVELGNGREATVARVTRTLILVSEHVRFLRATGRPVGDPYGMGIVTPERATFIREETARANKITAWRHPPTAWRYSRDGVKSVRTLANEIEAMLRADGEWGDAP